MESPEPNQQSQKPNDVGRPTDYSEDVLLRSKEYIESSNDQEDTDGRLRKVKLPSIEGLALFLGVHRDTMYEWASLHPQFSDILERVRQNQAETLINKGLSGDYNPTITKLMLSKHGYVEKSETDVTTKGQQITSINYVVPKDPNEERPDADADVEAAPGLPGA